MKSLCEHCYKVTTCIKSDRSSLRPLRIMRMMVFTILTKYNSVFRHLSLWFPLSKREALHVEPLYEAKNLKVIW